MLNQSLKICALIPTYNNAGTLVDVLNRTHIYIKDIIVVVDGSTDDTMECLKSVAFDVTVIYYKKNRGKGYALKQGFKKAKEMGFEYALTLDSDGQHYPENIPAMIEQEHKHPHSLVVGSRKLAQENMPKRNTFANRFSNFWYTVQTGLTIPDTQTGMRIYPIDRMRGLNFLTNRYEAELELLVFLTWAEVRVIPVPIDVYYPPKGERISHFKPFYDFTRISILNTLLCVLAVLYGYPRRYLHGVVFLVKLFLDCIFLMPFALVTLLFHNVKWVRYSFSRLSFHCIRWLVHHIDCARMEVKSAENECRKPCVFVVSSHSSILDALIVLSLRPKIVMLTQSWVPNNPLFGLTVRALELCSVSDGYEKIMDRLSEKVSEGYSIAVFPEGTRTLDGEINRFHKGAFYIAEQLNLPIQPVLLYGLYHVLNKIEFKSYRNPFFVEYLPFIEPDDKSFGRGFRERAKAFEAYFKQQKQINDDKYLNSIR